MCDGIRGWNALFSVMKNIIVIMIVIVVTIVVSKFLFSKIPDGFVLIKQSEIDSLIAISQLPPTFLEILGQTKILANGNGIDITSSEANLKGINRANKYNVFTVQSSNSPADMNYTTDNLVLYFYGSGYRAVLPTITEVRSKLGITGTFSVRLTVVVYYSSSGGTLWGRNSTLSGRNTSSYPQLKTNDGGNFNSIALASGDVTDLLLVYDGSEYVAYELNRRT